MAKLGFLFKDLCIKIIYLLLNAVFITCIYKTEMMLLTQNYTI